MAEQEANEELKTVVLGAPLGATRKNADKDALTTTGKLICTTPKLLDEGQESEVWLTHSEETLGCGDECSVKIRCSELARLHARITAYSNQWLIENCIGGPGTWINGTEIESRSKLSAGDVLKLGAAEFRFEVIDVSPSEFAVVPELPKVAEDKKVQFGQTLQLELSPDGELIDVSNGRPVTAPAGTAKSAADVSAANVKPREAPSKTSPKAEPVKTPDEGAAAPQMETVLRELDQQVPNLLRMLLAEARKGNVDAACACVNFAARAGGTAKSER